MNSLFFNRALGSRAVLELRIQFCRFEVNKTAEYMKKALLFICIVFIARS